MGESKHRVLHWSPEENRWVEVEWDAFCAFSTMFAASQNLASRRVFGSSARRRCSLSKPWPAFRLTIHGKALVRVNI